MTAGRELSEGARRELGRSEAGGKGSMGSDEYCGCGNEDCPKCGFVLLEGDLTGVRTRTVVAPETYEDGRREAAKGLRESADRLVWATSVEVQGGHRTRSFKIEHQAKCRHWIDEVKKSIIAFDAQFPPAKEGGEK